MEEASSRIRPYLDWDVSRVFFYIYKRSELFVKCFNIIIWRENIYCVKKWFKKNLSVWRKPTVQFRQFFLNLGLRCWFDQQRKEPEEHPRAFEDCLFKKKTKKNNFWRSSCWGWKSETCTLPRFFGRTKTNTPWRIARRLFRAEMIIRSAERGREDSIFCYLFWDTAWVSEMSGDFRIFATQTAAAPFWYRSPWCSLSPDCRSCSWNSP